MDNTQALARIQALSFWRGVITIAPLDGGLTNLNFVVRDDTGRYVVRFGEDMPEHLLLRFNELAAARAAHMAGISPALRYAEPGLSIIDFIEARTYSDADIRKPGALEHIIPLVRKCHIDVPKYLRGPTLIFWVFHVLRDYAATLREGASPYCAALPELMEIANKLEATAGPFDMVFGHNDLLAANILDDGARLWLIDWDYAGFNTPLFDLGGLASNNGLDEAGERQMLELYFDVPLRDGLLHRYHAMKCASLLRETMWSMVSEQTSALDIDYANYTAENLACFRQAYMDFVNM